MAMSRAPTTTGIYARNYGTDLSVTTGTTVTGGTHGIRAFNYGSGALTITANGDVEGTNATGIYAYNSFYGTDLSVTTGVDTSVLGGQQGIRARNYGTGALTVTADGDVEGTSDTGIYARNYGTDLGVTTGADTTVTGGNYGIRARNYGSGALTVTADGDVEGTNDAGIYARNSTAGTDLGVTTGTGTTVTGGVIGISAINRGSGALTVTADGDVEGTSSTGIYARNYGTDLGVTTGTTVTGGTYGIRAFNNGSGALTITANGNVEGTNATGINAYNSFYGTDLGVTTGVDTSVLGGQQGIRARNYGTGALTVTADGDVEGTNDTGIYARNSTAGTDLGVTTGAGTTVTGGGYGISAVNRGSGALTVTTNGDVEGTSSTGIYARNFTALISA